MMIAGYTAIEITEMLISAFFGMLFLQSGVDKIWDFQTNYKWMKAHFSSSLPAKTVGPLLILLTFLETLCGLANITGLIFLLAKHEADIVFYGILLAAINILLLFSGQRIAKDYAGAASLCVYFILSLFGLFLFSI